MASQSRAGRRVVLRRSQFLVALLLLMLALTGVLAYQAQDAARSYRDTAERTLHDYARIAVWGLNRNTQEMLFSGWRVRLDSARVQFSDPARAGAPGASTAEACHCFRGADPETRFALFPDGRLLSEGALPAGARSWILDSARLRPGARTGGRWEIGIAFPRASARGVAFVRRIAPARTDPEVLGFLVEPAQLGSSLEKVVQIAPVLPNSLLHGTPTDSMLSVEVTTADGRVVYSSARHYPDTFSASDTLPAMFGGLVLRVSLRPEAADRLVIGGVPRSRLPLLLGLLALTVALVVVALLQLRREAELARMREDFVSSVSHELRTPLAQIRMFAETLLLGRTRTEAERRRSLEIIDQEAKRLSHLVENVLQVSRASRGMSKVAPEELELTTEVAGIVESFRLFAAQKRAELRPELEARVVASVDRGGLRQMLVNLMDNAVKYGPAGQRVTVGLAVFGESARLWVDDEGPGIPAEEREKVFSAFYRSPRAAGSAVAGSGIGLAVVREIASLHGGRVWVDAAPGGGTRVTIEIPGARVRAAAAAGDGFVAA